LVPNGTLTVSVDQIKSGLTDSNNRLTQLEQRVLSQQPSIDSITIDAQQIAATQQEQATRQAQQLRQQQNIQAEQSSVYLLSTVAGFIDPKLSKPIATIGNSAISLVSALNTFAILH
jgi:hypothetical protein